MEFTQNTLNLTIGQNFEFNYSEHYMEHINGKSDRSKAGSLHTIEITNLTATRVSFREIGRDRRSPNTVGYKWFNEQVKNGHYRTPAI